jgi:hypothetical protein
MAPRTCWYKILISTVQLLPDSRIRELERRIDHWDICVPTLELVGQKNQNYIILFLLLYVFGGPENGFSYHPLGEL